MSRKAIRGYSEKSYYDNNRFKGIVASSDPLNEGYFAHMVNFDISDTGNSLKPRHGFLTTDLLIKVQVLNKYEYDTLKLKALHTIYFYEQSLQKYIFIDFSKASIYYSSADEKIYGSVKAYTVSFELMETEDYSNRHFEAEEIQTVDISDLINIIAPYNSIDTEDCTNIENEIASWTFRDNEAKYTKDEYLISKFLVKQKLLKYLPLSNNFTATPYTWLSMYYRKKGSTYNEITYTFDTLVISYLNTEDVMSINSNDRNIASTKSIIPDPMQEIYPESSTDILFNQFPMIYVKENSSGKYLTLNAKNSNVTIIPHFLLKEQEDTTWMYSYDITSTYTHSALYDNNTYHSDIYSITNNKTLDELWTDAINNELDAYFEKHGTNDYIQHLKDHPLNPSYNNISSMHLYWMMYKLYNIMEDEGKTNTWAEDIIGGELKTTNNVNTLEKDNFSESSLPEYLRTIDTNNISYFNSTDYLNSVLIYVVPLHKKDHLLLTTSGNTSPSLYYHTLQGILRYIYTVLKGLRENNIVDTNYYTTYYSNIKFISDLLSKTSITKSDLLTLIDANLLSDIGFIITPFRDITRQFEIDPEIVTPSSKGLLEYKHFSLYSGILVTDTEPVSAKELIDYISNSQISNVVFKFMRTVLPVDIDKDTILNIKEEDPRATQIIPNTSNLLSARPSNTTYYFYTSDTMYTDIFNRSDIGNIDNTPNTGLPVKYKYQHLEAYFFDSDKPSSTDDENYPQLVSIPLLDPIIRNPNRSTVQLDQSDIDSRLWAPHSIKIVEYYTTEHSHFSPLSYMHGLSFNVNPDNINNLPGLKDLHERRYFSNGVNLKMQLIPAYVPTTFLDMIEVYASAFDPIYLNASTSLINTVNISYDSTVTYIQNTLTEEPKDIANSDGWCIFHSDDGDRIVTWIDNKVYVSEAERYYYFKNNNVFTYPEKVLKVIQFKNTLLVFTTINLYSIYPYTDRVSQENGVDDEGNIQYVQTDIILYATLPVLYNIMLTKQYIDAIQVFNQMVLFYSADGQLFMIKPTATIDNDTKFSIQYFNKSANNILAHYDEYMNARLQEYGSSLHINNKDDVEIKVQVNLNFIKIFYMYEEYTYILIYDIINNYFFVYDTMSFSGIKNILFTDLGDTYITSTKLADDEDYMYFTVVNNIPNQLDNNIDEAVYNNFVDAPILSEIDTGIINLNNHLKKRFRNLYTTYKNISATSLQYTLETFIDDIIAQSSLSDTLTVTSATVNEDTENVYACVTLKSETNLLADNTALFDFSLFTSNKILTHYSNIPCLGKQFRLRLRFSSKGNYKLQSYGFTFKEHQI